MHFDLIAAATGGLIFALAGGGIWLGWNSSPDRAMLRQARRKGHLDIPLWRAHRKLRDRSWQDVVIDHRKQS